MGRLKIKGEEYAYLPGNELPKVLFSACRHRSDCGLFSSLPVLCLEERQAAGIFLEPEIMDFMVVSLTGYHSTLADPYGTISIFLLLKGNCLLKCSSEKRCYIKLDIYF